MLKKLVTEKNYEKVLSIRSLESPSYWASTEQKLLNFISTRTRKKFDELTEEVIVNQIKEIKQGTEY